MENNEKCVLKWRRNVRAVWVGHGIAAVVDIIFLIAALYKKSALTWLWCTLAVGFIAVQIVILIYTFTCGGATPIYLDGEKVWGKIKGQRCEWRWDEMTSCSYLTVNGFYTFPKILVIVTKQEYQKLTFECNSARARTLMRICPNQEIKRQLNEIWRA